MIWNYFKNKRIKQEEYYQIILKNWKEKIKFIDTKKNNFTHIECISSLMYADKKRNLEYQANFIKKHPVTFHWHIPKYIRKKDFLNFVENCSEDELIKLKHKYQAKNTQF